MIGYLPKSYDTLHNIPKLYERGSIISLPLKHTFTHYTQSPIYRDFQRLSIFSIIILVTRIEYLLFNLTYSLKEKLV